MNDPPTNSGPAALRMATSLAAGAGPLFLPEAVECLKGPSMNNVCRAGLTKRR